MTKRSEVKIKISLWQDRKSFNEFLFCMTNPKGRTFPNYRLSAFFYRKSKKTKKIFFVFFLVFQRKLLASVYERHNESSIIPPSEKPLLKILAVRWFLLS
jgi:hypothetical protein